MADLYQYYNTNDDAAGRVRQADWVAQTFTPAIAHTITSVKLKLWRDGAPVLVTVGIRATDAEGKPTGEDLCFGTIAGADITDADPGQWYEITLGEGCDLDVDTTYAIVVRAPEGSFFNWVYWRYDQTAPTYERGNRLYSASAVVGWTVNTARDQMFEEWGEEIVYIPTVTTQAATDIGLD